MVNLKSHMIMSKIIFFHISYVERNNIIASFSLKSNEAFIELQSIKTNHNNGLLIRFSYGAAGRVFCNYIIFAAENRFDYIAIDDFFQVRDINSDQIDEIIILRPPDWTNGCSFSSAHLPLWPLIHHLDTNGRSLTKSKEFYPNYYASVASKFMETYALVSDELTIMCRSNMKNLINRANEFAYYYRSIRNVDFLNFTFDLDHKSWCAQNLKTDKVVVKHGKFIDGNGFHFEVDGNRIVYGDITKDNQDEAVVIINCGDIHRVEQVLIYTVRSGRPKLVAKLDASDLTGGKLVRRNQCRGCSDGAIIKNQLLMVERLHSAAKCCSEYIESRSYKWDGTNLKQVGDVQTRTYSVQEIDQKAPMLIEVEKPHESAIESCVIRYLESNPQLDNLPIEWESWKSKFKIVNRKIKDIHVIEILDAKIKSDKNYWSAIIRFNGYGYEIVGKKRRIDFSATEIFFLFYDDTERWNCILKSEFSQSIATQQQISNLITSTGDTGLEETKNEHMPISKRFDLRENVPVRQPEVTGISPAPKEAPTQNITTFPELPQSTVPIITQNTGTTPSMPATLPAKVLAFFRTKYQNIEDNKAFALALDVNGHYAGSFSVSSGSSRTWLKIISRALVNCEKTKKRKQSESYFVDAPCELYAIGNRIVHKRFPRPDVGESGNFISQNAIPAKVSPSSLPDDIEGLWVGTADLPGGEPYTVLMELEKFQPGKHCGMVEFPTFSCRGRLTCIERQDTSYLLAQEITYGYTRCLHASLQLILHDHNTMTRISTNLNKSEESAHGTLYRINF